MNNKRVFVFLALAAAVGIAAASGPATLQFRLAEDLMIGGPEADDLFLWTAVSVDRDGNIFFADALDDSVKKFGPDGRFLKKAGRKGQGPGEFDKAVGIVVSGETVYAWDVYSRKIQVFDRELVFQRSLAMPGAVGSLDVLSDGRLAVAARVESVLPEIFFLAPDGTELKKVPLGEARQIGRFDAVHIAADPSGGFHLGYLFSDKVEQRTADGALVRSMNPFGVRLSAPKDYQSFKLPTETCVQGLALDAAGRIYVLGGKAAARPGRDVLVFHPDGTDAGSFVLPEPSHSLYFDRQSRLYVSADGGVTMKRYRLTVE